ncbi:MAG: diguanylate cyclase domain-containing protein [Actinomycetota bacterium]
MLLASRDEEIQRLRRLVDAFIPIDVDTGMLNRNGVLDAIRRAWTWWNRRREPFGVMSIIIPAMANRNTAASTDLARKVAIALSDAGRAVDDIGRLDDHTFAVVLREFQRHGAATVVSRMRTTLREAVANPEVTSEIRFGLIVAVESESTRPEDYLDLAVSAARTALPDVPNFA